MRQFKKVGALLSLTVLLLVGCGASENHKQANNQLSVYTSIYPMYDLASKIGGDKIQIINLVPAGTEPHDWEPTTTDIVNLEKADMFIYNGVGMEHWVDKVLTSLQNKELLVVETSIGLELLEGHHHEETEEHVEHEDENEFDPHVWLSIRNAKKQMENIKNAFVEMDVANRDYYESNYNTYAAKFDELDETYKQTLGAFSNKDIIVAHQAFSYLCKDYGLNQVAIEGLSPDSEPDPGRMSEIIQMAKEKQIKVIFFEELTSPKVAETIAREIGASTEVLNPLEGLSGDQLLAGEDYLSIMEKNLEALKKALE